VAPGCFSCAEQLGTSWRVTRRVRRRRAREGGRCGRSRCDESASLGTSGTGGCLAAARPPPASSPAGSAVRQRLQGGRGRCSADVGLRCAPRLLPKARAASCSEGQFPGPRGGTRGEGNERLCSSSGCVVFNTETKCTSGLVFFFFFFCGTGA
jgi:hypothetical protein